MTIGFVDLVNSTTLVESIGDEDFVDLIEEIGSLTRDLANPYRGHVPRHEGDGWMVVFGSARRALRWAIDLQRSMLLLASRHGEIELAARIGLHTGESIQAGTDFQGRHVHYAARVAETAGASTIHVSDLTWQIARGSSEFRFGEPTLTELRGFEQPTAIYELIWKQVAVEQVADS